MTLRALLVAVLCTFFAGLASAQSDTFPNFAWRNPLPEGGTLNAVIHAQSKFIAAGGGGRVITSTAVSPVSGGAGSVVISITGTMWAARSTRPSERFLQAAYSKDACLGRSVDTPTDSISVRALLSAI